MPQGDVTVDTQKGGHMKTGTVGHKWRQRAISCPIENPRSDGGDVQLPQNCFSLQGRYAACKGSALTLAHLA